MDINVGVHAIILNEKNEILLSERLKKVEYKTFSVPAGHVCSNETLEDAMARELNEELGIVVLKDDLEVVCVAKNADYINFGILVKKYSGDIKNMEPIKVGRLEYFKLDDLPKLFTGSKSIIELYLNKEFYNKNNNT